ncbi:Uncharacterized conserved protein, DUF2141 family [Thiohalospira halophila DSM 15071]|uniref:Uncharacterized conserved protein, DUF2141 family n=1 Tax=Thiohalospira halophila DSM 15071 TaxID=1123397 RepID=A0A1I1SXK2_9GAMM|nr:DUF2141 domain-containing protein [Thiohalospira halophila]SFD48663.1 Uncharacterized conserved protein, DUF2141 family [Thiohalospira halophila DSM 15071]
MRRRLLTGVTAAMAAGLLAGPVAAADLTVEVAGVAGESGQVRVDLYADAETFREPEQALHRDAVPAREGTATFAFEDLEPGRYAVIAYHDEDGDGGMDRFLGMIPTEPWGLSNNIQVSGPPAFDDAAFDLPASGTVVTIRLND